MPLFVPAVVQAEPQPKRTLTKYALSYIVPSEFKKRIDGNDPKKTLRPPGLDNLIASDIDRCIIAQGTAEALAELKALLRLLDVKPVASLTTVSYSLTHQSATDLLEQLKGRALPKGTQLSANEQENALVAQTTPEGHAALKQLLSLLDVPVKQVLLKATWVENKKLVMAPTLATLDSSEASLSLGDEKQSRSLAVTPHLNTDGKTITLTIQINQEAPLVRTVALGAPLTLAFGEQGELTITATVRS